MREGAPMLDWDDLRFFLALSRHSSLSAAARELRVAQSTVGRRLASLEASLGVRLLNRTPDGYAPTQAGESVRAHAERLEAETTSLERDVGSSDTSMVGLVRMTCAETVATHILAPLLASLHIQEPDQHDLVVRRIGTIAFGLYVSPEYLERHGDLNFGDGCSGHHLITQFDDIEDASQTGWLTDRAFRVRVAMQTSSHEAAVAAAIHGGGLACLACFRADREGGLKRLSIPPPVPTAHIWLVVHKDNRQTPRIRVCLTHITEHVRRMSSALNPADAGDAVASAR